MTTTATTVKTKSDARAIAVETALTINWEGMEQADIIALAQQSLVIKLQAQLRKLDTIPDKMDVKATDYRVGVRQAAAPAKLDNLIGKLSAEERAKLIERLMAGQ